MHAGPALMIPAFALVLVACAQTLSPSFETCPREAAATARGYWVCAVGSRNSMLDSGDLSGNITLSDLPNSDELIAVGPVEGLQGEITIYRGKRFISVVSNERDITRIGQDARAIFLAYGAAEAWVPISIEEPVEGFDAIEAFITAQAKENGFKVDDAFPFRIEGRAETLEYHVIFKTDGEPHDRAAHQRAKIKFPADSASIAVAGIWADEASVGRYTHPGRRSHMHVVIDDGTGSGHIDAIRIAAGSTLYLPSSAD